MYNKRQSYDAWFLRHGDWRKECFVILDHFLLFYSPNNLKNQHFKPVYHKWQLYNVCFQVWSLTDRIFVILGHFLPFQLPDYPKCQNFKIEKKTHSDIIILHKCTKNHNNMLHCSWDMARNGCNCYFSFWAILCPFTSLTASKIKI